MGDDTSRIFRGFFPLAIDYSSGAVQVTADQELTCIRSESRYRIRM